MKATDRARYQYPWALALAKMKARACTISQIVNTTEAEARALYKEANHGKSSPSGQQPVDIAWYTLTPERRFQSALLLVMYERACRSYPPGLALTHAYYHFSCITSGEWEDPYGTAFRDSEKDYQLNFARANYLVKIYDDQKDLYGARKSQLQLVKCRVCGTIILSQSDDADHRCPICIKSKDKPKKAE
ncbi:MAG: hypothetical protein EPN64_04460 [Burkholderiaceae bacterium]|nr:MAG: hypothetical protein EPN64_04460 [Burkholderiaceae bacterium]